ncbi:MAG: hypothetical protein M3Y49_15170 [Actinomycetota bacterium]|nr:hypothetical protein [Actinomycetota bacterium]
MSVVTTMRTPPARRPVTDMTRGHLRLVFAGGSLQPQHALQAEHLLPAADSLNRSTHITRRGRLLISCSIGLLCVVGLGAGVRVLASAQAPAPVFQTVTVQAGQTLSEIAHRAYPDLAVGNAVTRVQLTNNLNTSQVYAGEQLRLAR